MLDLQHQYNNCTTIPHMRVGPTYWGPPSCEGLLYSCCSGVVQESNPMQKSFGNEYFRGWSPRQVSCQKLVREPSPTSIVTNLVIPAPPNMFSKTHPIRPINSFRKSSSCQTAIFFYPRFDAREPLFP